MSEASETMTDAVFEEAAPATDDAPEPVYAVVEIFGHRRHAGRIIEVEQFGAKMLRVDVPKEGDFEKGYVSHFYGGASIFSITHTDIETVRRMNIPPSWQRPGYQSLPAPGDDDLDDRDLDDTDLAP